MNRNRSFPLLPAGLLLVLLVAACAPAAMQPSVPTTPPARTATAIARPTRLATAPAPTAQPAVLETRRLSLDWPPVIRAGDGDVIRLTLEVDGQGNLTPTAAYEGHLVTGETVAIPDIFETHNVLAEARLDLAGMQVDPAGQVSETLRPGQRVIFSWSVHPDEAGLYRGTLWFFLRFIPIAGGPESSRALAALPIEIEAVSFFGLRAGPARWLGAIGSFVGGVLGLPFLEDILRFLFRKKPNQPRRKMTKITSKKGNW